jgi:hypothetical protein
MICPVLENQAGSKVRTSKIEPENQELASSGSQGESQTALAPDLAIVVTTWPSLSQALREAILAIVKAK